MRTPERLAEPASASEGRTRPAGGNDKGQTGLVEPDREGRILTSDDHLVLGFVLCVIKDTPHSKGEGARRFHMPIERGGKVSEQPRKVELRRR